MRAAVLVGFLGLIGIGIWWVARPPETAAPAPPENPPAPAPQHEPVGEWAGSESCAACHPDIHARWSKTAHALTIRPYSDDAVKKPFDGEVFTARDEDHKVGPGGSMTCKGPGGEVGRFEVEMVIGVRRIQMFTTRVDGRMQVLPVFLEVPKSKWFDYTDFIFGGPTELEVPDDSAYSWYGTHRNFSSRCGRCHMTNYAIGYDADAGTYDTTWSEPVVGCESCHGAAGKHVEKWRALADGPDPIVNPVRLPPERRNMVCGYCHSESTMRGPGYKPGDDLFETMDVAALEDEKHLHPDGRAAELIHNLVPIMESRCQPITCSHCHDPHGRGEPGDLIRPLSDDRTCTQCHSDIGNKLTEHTHHAAASEGSRCVNCHMPRLVIEGGHGRVFDHTISTPSIANTRRWGLPNACRTCHLTKRPGWEYEHFEAWYPGADERNHRVPLAAAIAAARQRLPEAKSLLLALLKDENPIYRAAAATYLGPIGGVDLKPLLDDKHPLVRRAAVDGVALSDPDALVPLLGDKSVVMRRAAAMALASRRVLRPFDWIAKHPELRHRVIGVLEECIGLRPDDADLHGTVQRLYEQAGRPADAAKARARYQRLRPWQK